MNKTLKGHESERQLILKHLQLSTFDVRKILTKLPALASDRIVSCHISKFRKICKFCKLPMTENITAVYSAYFSSDSVKCIGKTRAKLLIKSASGE